jgi:ABC-2 type transport system permease protein
MTITADGVATGLPTRGRLAGLAANARGVYIIWYRDVLRYRRDRARLVSSLGQPLLFLVVFGSGLTASLGAGLTAQLGNVSYVRFLFPGIVAMAVLFTAVFSAISIVWDREFGFLREVLVAPLSRAAVVTGKALGGSTVAMFQGAILLILAPILGVSLNPLLVLQLLGLMFLTAFALTSMGILIAARLQSLEAFQMIMNFLILPMFFLSGAFFPLKGLPAWMSVITRLDPVAYGVDPMRRLLLGADLAPGINIANHYLGTVEDCLILAAFAAVMMVVAVWAFEAQE